MKRETADLLLIKKRKLKMHHNDYNLHVNKQWRGPLPNEKITGKEVWSAVPAIRWLLIVALIAITVKLIW